MEKGIAAPNPFSAHVYCGQTAACIRMPLGTEVGFGPSDIVLDGDLAPPHGKGHSSPQPIFRPMSIVTKWLDGPGYHLTLRYVSAQATLC